MADITITREPDITDERQDAVFYVGDHFKVIEVSDGTRTFGVYVCGETRAHVWNDEAAAARGDDPAGRVWNDGRKWAAFGIKTDDDLTEAENRIEWVNNSWYEVYELTPDSDDGRRDGTIFHEHKAAVRYITKVLTEDEPVGTVRLRHATAED